MTDQVPESSIQLEVNGSYEPETEALTIEIKAPGTTITVVMTEESQEYIDSVLAAIPEAVAQAMEAVFAAVDEQDAEAERG